jgi:DNA-binding NarL/FixJ family response regulator
MTDRSPIRVVLADDHDLVRAGIRALFERLPNVKVVGEGRDGQETLEIIERELPDIAFVDISMPILDGLSLIRRVSSLNGRVRLIVLSMYSAESYVSEALRAGASGYLLKQNADLSELQLAIESVMDGGRYLTPAISRQVVDGFLRSQHPETRQTLTPRQREILRLIGEGHGTKEIAYRLNISAKTVDTHRAELMERLGIHDIAGLVRYAIQTGLVSLDDN